LGDKNGQRTKADQPRNQEAKKGGSEEEWRPARRGSRSHIGDRAKETNRLKADINRTMFDYAAQSISVKFAARPDSFRLCGCDVRSRIVEAFFEPRGLAVNQGFQRRSSPAQFALMGSFGVVKLNPYVELLLQLTDGFEQGLSEDPQAREHRPVTGGDIGCRAATREGDLVQCGDDAGQDTVTIV